MADILAAELEIIAAPGEELFLAVVDVSACTADGYDRPVGLSTYKYLFFRP